MKQLTDKVNSWDLKTIGSSALKIVGGAGALSLLVISGASLPLVVALVALSAMYTLTTGKQFETAPALINL